MGGPLCLQWDKSEGGWRLDDKRSWTTGQIFFFFFKCPSIKKANTVVSTLRTVLSLSFTCKCEITCKICKLYSLLCTFFIICELSINNRIVTNTFYGVAYPVCITVYVYMHVLSSVLLPYTELSTFPPVYPC